MSSARAMVGADVAALEAAARELSTAADELDLSARSLTSSLGSLQWIGAVALRFSDAWNGQHNPGMSKTAAFLRDNSERLRRQAAEQRAASAADGGGGLTSIRSGGVFEIPSGATPAEVAEWWRSLTDEQRKSISASAPGVIGNLNGVPFEVRYEANRAYMQELLNAETNPDGPIHQMLRNFIDSSGNISELHKIILFDPSGDGKIAEVFGDVAKAKNVVVMVPGYGSTVESFGSVQEEALRLQTQAGGATAVIAWTGYDAPNNPLEVSTDAMAKAGAVELSSFVAGIRTESSGSVIPLGHSYGSVVVGEALKSGLQVETVIFIGSPGVGVDSVTDFPPGAADRYFAGEIAGDPVASLEHFGESPTDPDFGAQVFDAGSGGTFSHHSHYIDPGQGMDNIVRIVNGGQPSADLAAPIDYIVEPLEDVSQAIGGSVDWAQERVELPYVDGAVDSVIDGGQRVAETASNIVETGVEYVSDTAAEATDWVADNAVKAADVLTFWN